MKEDMKMSPLSEAMVVRPPTTSALFAAMISPRSVVRRMLLPPRACETEMRPSPRAVYMRSPQMAGRMSPSSVFVKQPSCGAVEMTLEERMLPLVLTTGVEAKTLMRDTSPLSLLAASVVGTNTSGTMREEGSMWRLVRMMGPEPLLTSRPLSVLLAKEPLEISERSPVTLIMARPVTMT